MTTVDGHVRSVAVCMVSRVALRLDLSEPVARAVAEEVATLEGSRHEASIAAQVATEGLRPSTPHLYLATTGTSPELQRRGLATKTLLPMLAQADEERLDIFLETSTASNVAFYERLGFRIDGHVRIADGGPDVWGMLRSPVSPGG